MYTFFMARVKFEYARAFQRTSDGLCVSMHLCLCFEDTLLSQMKFVQGCAIVIEMRHPKYTTNRRLQADIQLWCMASQRILIKYDCVLCVRLENIRNRCMHSCMRDLNLYSLVSYHIHTVPFECDPSILGPFFYTIYTLSMNELNSIPKGLFLCQI